MANETRRQYIERHLEGLITSNRKSINIDLYGDEIRRFGKEYEKKLRIEKGPKTGASAEDKRYNCKIIKK